MPKRSKTTKSYDPFRPAIDETKKRRLRERRIPVLTYRHDWDSDEPTLTMPGTITVFVAKKGERALEQVRAAVGGGRRELKALQRSLKAQFGRGRKLSPERTAASIVRSEVFADVRYGGETVSRGIFLPRGVKVFPLVLPYNGGRLAAGGFTLNEYLRPGSEAALEAVVVKNSPPLTRAERAALGKVPKTQLVQNVGVAAWCDTTWIAVAVVVADAVAAAATIVLAQCGHPELDDYLHVSQKEIAALGPAASARKLLDLRRQELAALTR